MANPDKDKGIVKGTETETELTPIGPGVYRQGDRIVIKTGEVLATIDESTLGEAASVSWFARVLLDDIKRKNL